MRRRLVWLVLSAVLLLPMSAAAQDVVEYYGTDALGSVRIVFDVNGNVVGRMDYGPFGEQVTISTVGHKSYAGLFRDGEAGLDYAEARSYQVRTGRFSAPDPVYAGLFAPQAWNRYAYALNNPVTFVDPTGLAADSCTTVDTYTEAGLVTTLKCKNSGTDGGSGGWGSIWDTLSWALTRTVDVLTGTAVSNGPDADRMPYATFSPSPGVETAFNVALLGATIAVGVKGGAGSAAVTTGAVQSTATKSAGSHLLKAGLTLDRGNAKAGLEHILRRHSFNSGAENASRFLRGDGFIEIRALISEAAGSTTAWRIEGSQRVLDASIGRMVGYDQAGSAVSGLRVVTDASGRIITAYPIGIR